MSRVDPTGESAADFFAGWGDALTLGGTKYLRKWVGEAFGVVDANESVDTESGWYTAGQVAGAVNGAALAGGAAAHRFGWRSKITWDKANHYFGRFDRLPHLQFLIFREGVKNSHRIMRIPLPHWMAPRK